MSVVEDGRHAGGATSAAGMAKYHLQFTEEMKGFFAFNEADFQRGFDQGRASRAAVKFHLTNIYRKLGVSNRTEAARLAYQNGLVESPIDDR